MFVLSIERVLKYCLIVALLVLYNVSEVLAEYCRDYGHTCEPPFKCCMSRCCEDGDNDRPMQLTYYRWNIWNMWYFWFVVIFVLMSCFGGCGYYRRRQGLLFSNHHPRLSDPETLSQPRISVPVYPMTQIAYHNGTDNIAFYPVTAPPAYADVVNKPDLYPAAAKINTQHQPVAVNDGIPAPSSNGIAPPVPPPPYSEVTSTPPTQANSAASRSS